MHKEGVDELKERELIEERQWKLTPSPMIPVSLFRRYCFLGAEREEKEEESASLTVEFEVQRRMAGTVSVPLPLRSNRI